MSFQPLITKKQTKNQNTRSDRIAIHMARRRVLGATLSWLGLPVSVNDIVYVKQKRPNPIRCKKNKNKKQKSKKTTHATMILFPKRGSVEAEPGGCRYVDSKKWITSWLRRLPLKNPGVVWEAMIGKKTTLCVEKTSVERKGKTSPSFGGRKRQGGVDQRDRFGLLIYGRGHFGLPGRREARCRGTGSGTSSGMGHYPLVGCVGLYRRCSERRRGTRCGGICWSGRSDLLASGDGDGQGMGEAGVSSTGTCIALTCLVRSKNHSSAFAFVLFLAPVPPLLCLLLLPARRRRCLLLLLI